MQLEIVDDNYDRCTFLYGSNIVSRLTGILDYNKQQTNDMIDIFVCRYIEKVYKNKRDGEYVDDENDIHFVLLFFCHKHLCQLLISLT